MAINLTADQVRRLRLRGQSILPPQPDGPTAVVQILRQVLGLQAQDMFAATLGVRVRSHRSLMGDRATTLSDVERARSEERSAVWTWAMRGTLHLLAVDDLDWLVPLLGPVLVAAGQRRRQQLGLDERSYQHGLAAVCQWLSDHGPSTREELGAAMAAAGLPAGYSIERHLLYRAALEGTICMGPDRGAKPTFVLLEDWLGRPLASAAPEDALARLAARYLAAYAPATLADLAAWSGLPVRMLRGGWDALAKSLVEVTVAGKPAWLPNQRLAELDEPPPEAPSVHLLPAFDTYLLGYRSREWVVEPAYAGRINRGGGMIRPVLLVDGRVAGTWQTNRKGPRVKIVVDAFNELSAEVQAGIEAEVADIERFLEVPAAPKG